MAGHSKWSNIKHRKAAVDKKRGKIWTKISRSLIVAARLGGPDPVTNLGLRYAIDEARAANMPKDTIQRAIDKGAGNKDGDSFETVTYEGYGPAGVAILVDALTDNRTRTAGDVRMIFGKYGGNIGNPGSVSYMFKTRGQIFVPAAGTDEERIMEVALEAGAEDVVRLDGEDGGAWLVVTEPAAFLAVKQALAAAGIEAAEAEITKIPETTSASAGDDAVKLLKLVDALEDNDDVQKVYHNAEIDGDVLASLA